MDTVIKEDNTDFVVLADLIVAPIVSPHLAGFLKRFLSMLVGGLLVPVIIKLMQNHDRKKAQAAAASAAE